LITALAQPTPERTAIAPSAQLVAQAPHSMQRSRATIRARFCSIDHTPWGQTFVQVRHPLHLPASSSRVARS